MCTDLQRLGLVLQPDVVIFGRGGAGTAAATVDGGRWLPTELMDRIAALQRERAVA